MARLYAELAEATVGEDGSVDPARFDAHCRAEVETRHDDLAASLRKSDAFAAVAHVGYANLTNDPNTFAESTHEGLLATVEDVAGVFLAGPQRLPTGEARPATGRLVAEWNQSVKDLLHIEHARLSVNRGDHVLADARRSQVTRNLLVRGAAFRWQEQGLCRDLFGSPAITADLEALVGFSVDDALRMTEWLIRRPVEKMTSTMAALRTLVDRVVETVNGTAEAPEVPVAMIEQLGKLPEDQREDAAAAFMVDRVFATIGPRLGFTPEDLAAGSGSTLQAARQFLDLFSLSFGDLTGMDGFRCMQEARARPVLYDKATSTYMCVLVDDLVWALRPGLQAVLKKGGKAVWNRFDSARSRLSEARAEELLAAVVAPDQVWGNLRWREGDQVFELDRLMFVDDVALVIEVKGGELTPAARRGAPETLGRDVRKLVTDADEQAQRLRVLLESGERLTFDTADGSSFVIDTSAIRRVHSIVMVLDDLFALTPRMWALTEQGLLAGDHPAPLVVSVHELEILADLLDRPSVLVHYLLRRERFNLAQSLEAFEELDLVMDYITGGLIWDPPADEAEPVLHLLASSTDDLDAYYLRREGKRSAEASKPAVVLPPLLDSMVRAFEAERPPVGSRRPSRSSS